MGTEQLVWKFCSGHPFLGYLFCVQVHQYQEPCLQPNKDKRYQKAHMWLSYADCSWGVRIRVPKSPSLQLVFGAVVCWLAITVMFLVFLLIPSCVLQVAEVSPSAVWDLLPGRLSAFVLLKCGLEPPCLSLIVIHVLNVQ